MKISLSDKCQLEKYYSLPEGIRDICPWVMEDKDIMFALQQVEVYSKHLEQLINNLVEGDNAD